LISEIVISDIQTVVSSHGLSTLTKRSINRSLRDSFWLLGWCMSGVRLSLYLQICSKLWWRRAS